MIKAGSEYFVVPAKKLKKLKEDLRLIKNVMSDDIAFKRGYVVGIETAIEELIGKDSLQDGHPSGSQKKD